MYVLIFIKMKTKLIIKERKIHVLKRKLCVGIVGSLSKFQKGAAVQL